MDIYYSLYGYTYLKVTSHIAYFAVTVQFDYVPCLPWLVYHKLVSGEE